MSNEGVFVDLALAALLLIALVMGWRQGFVQALTRILVVDVYKRQGSFTVVLGHNGSGKSTFAKHLNAVLLPCGGAVYVEGMDTRDERMLLEIRRRTGMVDVYKRQAAWPPARAASRPPPARRPWRTCAAAAGC